jgi:F-type H+-transporting ATPase subunit b
MKKLSFMTTAALSAALMLGVASAQEHKAEPAKASETKTEQSPDEHKAAGHEAAATEGEHGATKSEGGGDSHKQFTESPSVQWLAAKLGVETKTAYWISVLLNFAVLAGAFIWVGRKSVPQMFRDRTSAIQKGMEEAREASAKAAARLTEIESRLGKLDTEIATMRSQAETEARAEEERLKAATEEEKRKIVQSAEQEITAAANTARRELKNLAAELAVSLAEKKISVDESTDKVLVRDFANNLNQNPNAKGGN